MDNYLLEEDRHAALASRVRALARPLEGAAGDYDALLEVIGDARFVLIGEASHGTHEFYRERAEISKRLIAEKGFSAIAVEADWPDAYRVNRYVRGASSDAEAVDALAGFKRFPTWMWRNADVLDFIGWLRDYNDALAPGADRIGFYGLDLYSLYASIQAVLAYLDQVDAEAARRARQRYGCFDHFGEDSQAYGYAVSFGLGRDCEDQVVRQLVELYRGATEYLRHDGEAAEDEFFHAEQNARLIRNAERYYRTMFDARISSWNLRDQHMGETLVALEAHLGRRGRPPKIVVWAHNSHLGDARATEMGRRGELNLGQLTRERYGDGARLIGLTTYQGSVTAASEWDAPAERKRVRAALPGSHEALFHAVGIPRFWLDLRAGEAHGLLSEAMLERAIGVIYLPASERVSHYFHARLVQQFDAVLHFDSTRAVEPLERSAQWQGGEVPETFPSGI